MADNRSLILANALNLFAARGYDAIGVQEIAQSVNVSKPTLYYYFGSKRGILDVLVAEGFNPFIIQLSQAAAYSGDLPLTLRQIVDCYFQFATREPTLYMMHLSLWFAPAGSEASGVITPLIREQQSLVETTFQLATHDHGNMQGRQQRYAFTLLGMINTYITLAKRGHLVLDEQTVKQVVGQFSYGIYS